MSSLNKMLVVGAAFGALAVSACATQRDIDEAVAPVSAQTQANASEIGRTQNDVAALTGQVNDVSATAREALDRAKAAGVLAQGKFLYSVVLSDDSVKFPVNSSELSPEAMARLDELVNQLKNENQNVYLEIQGYTDATGSADGNEKLGEQRAEAVRRYLAQQGVPLSRIATISYGEQNPVAPNDSRQGRAQNRRVVIQVLS